VFFGITDKRVFELKYLNLIGLARVAIPTGNHDCQKKLLFISLEAFYFRIFENLSLKHTFFVVGPSQQKHSYNI
jgi:hypothetical protein